MISPNPNTNNKLGVLLSMLSFLVSMPLITWAVWLPDNPS